MSMTYCPKAGVTETSTNIAKAKGDFATLTSNHSSRRSHPTTIRLGPLPALNGHTEARKCPDPPRGHPPAGQDLPRPESALDHDQDDPSRGRDAQIGRPKNDRCRPSKADAWASLPDWQEADEDWAR